MRRRGLRVGSARSPLDAAISTYAGLSTTTITTTAGVLDGDSAEVGNSDQPNALATVSYMGPSWLPVARFSDPHFFGALIRLLYSSQRGAQSCDLSASSDSIGFGL